MTRAHRTKLNLIWIGLTVLLVLLSSVPTMYVHVWALQTVGKDLPAASNCILSRTSNVSKPMQLLCSVLPSDNAFVDNLLPTKQFGGLGVLIVENLPSVPIAKNYAFLKFNLSQSLPDSLIRSLANPLNASLRLFVRLTNFFDNATVEIHSASPENWTEETITWNTMPQIGPAFVSANVQNNGTWITWDVTRLLQPVWNQSGEAAFAALSSETDWKNLVWFDSKEYEYSNGTTTPSLELTFVEPFLTLETPYPNLPVEVGDRHAVTDCNGAAHLLLPWGVYSISIPPFIPLGNGTRAAFEGWSDGESSSMRVVALGNNLTLRATYVIQNRMEVISPYGATTGGGWYLQNTVATVSLVSTAVPLLGAAGWLGGRYVFDHWTGDCSGSNVPCLVFMNGTKSVTAIWRVDWTFTILVTVILVTGLTAVSLRHQLRTRSKPRKKKGAARTTRARGDGIGNDPSNGQSVGWRVIL